MKKSTALWLIALFILIAVSYFIGFDVGYSEGYNICLKEKFETQLGIYFGDATRIKLPEDIIAKNGSTE